MERKEKELDNARVFVDPSNEESKYYISSPTAEDIRQADWEYSRVYTKSLIAGITTSSEMTDILMRRGIIGKDFEQRAEELSEILNDKIAALNSTKDLVEKQYLAIEVAEARDNVIQWNQRLQAPLSNTCEHIADDSRIDYLTSRMVKDSNGDSVWEEFTDYLKEGNRGLARQARYEVMLYLQGLPSNVLDTTPEAMALKEVSEELMNASKELEEEVKEEVVSAEEVDKDVEKQVKKKRGRPKKKDK